MQEELTYTQKIYLFAIYKLGQGGGDVKSTEVAKIVGVSKASTASMTVKLCESGFIQKEHYGKITLTENGIKAANSIYTSCVIIKDFLQKTLRLDEQQADIDAVNIAAHTSQEALDRLAGFILEKTR